MKIIALLEKDPEKGAGLPFIPTLSYPDSAMVRSGNPVFLPEFTSSYEALFFLGVKVSRLGKSIAGRFAERYYSQAAPVLVVWPGELLAEMVSRGLPWTSAACFDRSVLVGDFLDYSELKERGELKILFSDIPEVVAGIPSTQEIAVAIQEVSRNNALKMGDLILIPLSLSSGSSSLFGLSSIPLHPDTFLKVCSGEEVLLKTTIK